MKLLFSLLALAVFTVALLPTSSAIITVFETQEEIDLVIERGTKFEFPLLLSAVTEEATLVIEGDENNWVGFWDNSKSEFDIGHGQPYILIEIDVPEDAELDEYDFEIKTGNTVLSEIKVKVTIQMSDAKAYEKLEGVGEEVGSLKTQVLTLSTDIGDLRSEISTLQSSVSEKVDEIAEYQRDLSELENENEELLADREKYKKNYEEARDSNTELTTYTGMLVGTQIPGMFTIGIILGITFVTVIVKRELVKRKVKEKVRPQKPGYPKDEDKFRYSYTGK